MNNSEQTVRMIPEYEAYRMLQKYSIPVPEHRFACNEADAVAAARTIGYPLVMKIVARDVLHKSDIGGVILGLRSEEDVRRAYAAIMQKTKEQQFKTEGVLISKMIEGGVETILGVAVDPEFGKYLVFGLGGVYVELFKDVAVRVLPVSKREAKEMLAEIKSFKLLTGYRGQKAKHVKGLIDVIINLSDLVEKENISEVDLNPVVVRDNDVFVLDARILEAQ